jgi:hypothetical protein
MARKYKQKYTTSDRIDMSKGGRVGYQQGGLKNPKRELEGTTQDSKERKPINVGRPVPDPVMGQPPKKGGPVKPPVKKPQPAPKPQPKPQPAVPKPAPVEIIEDQPPIQKGKLPWWKTLGYNSLAAAKADGWKFNKELREPYRDENDDVIRDEEEDDGEDEDDGDDGPQLGDEEVRNGYLYVYTTDGWFNTGQYVGDDYVVNDPDPDETPPPPDPPAAVGTTKAQTQRAERAGRAGQRMEDIATGELGLEDIGAKAEAVKTEDFRDEEGADIMTGEGVTIEEDTDALRGQDYKARVKTSERPSTVREGAEIVGRPDDITTSTADVMQVRDEEVDVQAAREREAREIEDVAPGEITAGVKFATVDELQAEAAKANTVDDILKGTYLVDEVGADDVTVSSTPDAERQERETITGETAPDAVAAQIDKTVGYEAAKARPVKGKAAQSAAADMIAQTADLPPEISSAIVQDPASVEAQIDNEPVEVQAAIAALPQEALVSSQMETLLGGMEDGEVPLWAKPAVDAINANMASRGLSVSTVGRDSLFNAIIQSALPMAQSNAQALQQRAAQNLSNEQQANLQQATQQQQLRLQNLANRQTAESQTAQMSQQMKVMQSQFDQQAVMTTAEQQQQTRMANLQNQQQAAVVQSQNEQQMRMQNLGNEQQIEMAELQIEAQVEGANQAAVNQERIAEMQVAADFISKNAGFKQQMELANLSNEQQMRLANLSARNQAESERLSNAEKTELANLNKTMQTNLLQANIAKDMGLAQLNVDQQSAIFKATTEANMDLTKFNSAQQIELANSKFMQTVALTNMNAEQQAIMQNATAMASMDLANLGTRERLAVQNAKNFLAMDMANMNNEQQANMMKAQQEQQRLLSDQAAFNAAEQFNATSENQTNQFMTSMAAQIDLNNAARIDAINQFNATQRSQAEARRVQRDVDVAKFNSQISANVDQYSKTQEFAREQFNAQNALIIEQSNVQWRRDITKADTAMQQQVNMMNAQNAFGMTQAAQAQLWQEMKDEFDYIWKSGENAADRDANMAIAGLQGDASALKETTYLDRLKSLITLIG